MRHHDIPKDDNSSLRPLLLRDFIGQSKSVDNLRIFIRSTQSRDENLDHIILHGPPGLGKTTLAQIISRELNVNFHMLTAPIITKTGDLAAILTNLKRHDVLFIDEIHRLNKNISEMLYPAMEDFRLDIIIGEGPSAKTVRIDLSKFTLIGATTRKGMLTKPLLDRFGIHINLELYNIHDLKIVITNSAHKLGINITHDASHEIATRSRGTPRIALRLLRRVRDFCHDMHEIDQKSTRTALNKLDINENGLDALDYKYLNFIYHNYGTNPVGIETISAAILESKETIENTVEPYLMGLGLLDRTPRGRKITQKAIQIVAH